MKIRIGTRQSRLAMAQTNIVRDLISSAIPNIEIEIVPIATRGDRIKDVPLSQIGGRGVFAGELEKALQNGKIDIAVHSAKDLPVRLGEGLEISGTPARGNPVDVILNRKGEMPDIMARPVIGTGSMRRRAFAGKHYPNAVFKDIRGNIDTRIQKLLDGQYDGIILAAAGLERLGIYESNDYDVMEFDCGDFLPAPCQGIIAVESRAGSEISQAMRKISCIDTFICFEAERQVLRLLDFGCSSPVGAYSQIINRKIHLSVSCDGKRLESGSRDPAEYRELAEELVALL